MLPLDSPVPSVALFSMKRKQEGKLGVHLEEEASHPKEP